jgi:DNA repair exonuclease SbcCD ATPase subunit
MERLSALTRDIEGLSRDIDTLAGELETEEETKKGLEDMIQRAGSADPALQKRLHAAKLAKEAFTKALEVFAASAREDIALAATAVAGDLLASKENYAAISVSEDYRVAPVDSAGKLQPVPAAGGQQLVTLALLAGLNATAATEAPIVMDTPLGRLDTGNRKRVIEWIAKLATGRNQQAVLMVHSGEVGDGDLQKWGVTPGRSYQISETGIYQAVVTEKS